MDPQTSPRPKQTVVAIGASAGGLAALKTFLQNVPSESGLAMVVVVHLSPHHESHLAELLQPHVRFPVQQVNETTLLEPNRAYVIPPNANLSSIDSHLRLTQLETQRTERAPIDHFFRTLSTTHDGNAVAVILTGTGSDGTLGLKDIKAKGGLVIVQDPNEAEYDGMPQSAIATGLADFILPVKEIPGAILRYDQTEPRVPVPKDGEDVSPNERVLLQKVFAQLRAWTDRDFSRYKRSTVMRRIARRMQLNYIEDLPHYLTRLRERPDEVRSLADDLLVTVTRFFRDPEVFDRLQKEDLPSLFERQGTQESIRVWSVGCATGEEAYSLAMALLEEAERHEASPNIQIFATDLHTRSLERAREGVYPGDIETDVPGDRLKRFFQRENGGYRIRKEIRDLVVFAPHNLLADPPFSRLDLISCRNLLIYLEREVQRDVVELFHYSLNPNGLLLLGSAETIDATDLFRIEDKKLCVFRKRNVPTREPRLPVFPLTWNRLPGESKQLAGYLPTPVVYGNLHQQMVERYAPPSILISPDHKLVHLSERAGRFLIHPGGEPTSSVLKLVRPELRIELQASLQAAREKRGPINSKPISVNFDGESHPVVLHVRPALEAERDGFVLVIFEEREQSQEREVVEEDAPNAGHVARVQELEAELTLTRQRLQSIIEEFETSQEEMKASSEEMQSTNEELRSTMEELETSKEELQSINEELQTVNQQNRHKVEELAQLSSDLQNLLAATDIATLFLDRESRILRFTPKLGSLFNVRITDRGRPISDLTHRLGYPNLAEDAGRVLDQLVPIEREVRDDEGRWYMARILPYRSTEDRIEGVVITFIDIDTRKRAEEAVRTSAERMRRMVNADVVGILMFDGSGMLVDCNDAFLKMSGYSREEVQNKELSWRRITPLEFVETSEQQMSMLAETGRSGPYEKQYIWKDGSRSWMICAGASLGDGTAVEHCIDITSRKRAEAAMEAAKLYAENIFKTLHEPLLVLAPDLRVQSANPAFYERFNVSPEETVGKLVYELGSGQWSIPALRRLLQEILVNNSAFEDFEVDDTFPNIGRRVMLLNARRLEEGGSILLGLRDITERKDAEEELRTAEHDLRSSNDDLKHFSYALSHDMREPLRMVVSYTQLLARDYLQNLDETARQYIHNAVEGAQRMESLLDDLRGYWSVSDKKVEDAVPVDCNGALDRAIQLLERTIAESKATITHGPLPTISAEEVPITLLFQNLVGNAIKYRRPDTPPEVHISARRNESHWHFSVDDNGIGIDEHYLDQIFSPFKRLHGTKYPGTGLGLAMCKKIVERYHGQIWAESAPGKGASIKFTLPAPGGEG